MERKNGLKAWQVYNLLNQKGFIADQKGSQSLCGAGSKGFHKSAIMKLIELKTSMKVPFLKGVILKSPIWFKCNLCHCEGVLAMQGNSLGQIGFAMLDSNVSEDEVQPLLES